MPRAQMGGHAPGMTAKVQAFIIANRKHRVVRGETLGAGMARFHLENGQSFDLTGAERDQLREVRWIRSIV